MSMTGCVDAVVGQTLSGWVRVAAGDEPVHVRLRTPQGTEETLAGIVRRDLASSPGRVFGFRLAVPPGSSIAGLADGSMTVEAACGDDRAVLTVWAPVLEAARIEGLDSRHLSTALRFASARKRLEIQRTVADHLRPWPPLRGTKRLACVIAYANDDGAWFPYFHAYYSGVLDARSIYVITPNPDSFGAYTLGGVVSLQGFPYDDNARAQMVSRFAQGLLAFHQWTIVCDVDEIIVPDPRTGRSFTDTLGSLDGPVSFTRGFDIVQMPDEADFDFSKPVLEQRRWAVANSAMCKPHFACKPVVWSGGYHYCDHPPRFEAVGSGFLTLHLKWACAEVRRKVAAIVQNTAYSDEAMAAYSLESVQQALHPRLANGPSTCVTLRDGSLEPFEENFVTGAALDTQRGMWIGSHFLGDGIVDLWS